MSRDQDILDAAERLFFERSFDGVGVDEIGKAAGISGSAIYGYFRGKDELLSALFGKAIDNLMIRIGEPDPDPHAELLKLLRAFVDLTRTHERLAAIWVREQRSLADRYRDEHHRRHRYMMERWSDCLGRCYPGRTVEELTTVTRGVQLLLLSEALRPPWGRRARDVENLLVEMALGAIEPLGRRRDTAGA